MKKKLDKDTEDKIKAMLKTFETECKSLWCRWFAAFTHPESDMMWSVKAGILHEDWEDPALWWIAQSVLIWELIDMIITYIIAVDNHFGNTEQWRDLLYKEIFHELVGDAKKTLLSAEEYEREHDNKKLCSPLAKNKMRQIINAVEWNYYGS